MSISLLLCYDTKSITHDQMVPRMRSLHVSHLSAVKKQIAGHKRPRTDNVLMVKGRNGKNLLMLNGYTYYQHKHLRDGYRWSCTQMGSRSCRGFLHVTQEMLVVRAYIEHTHPPSTYFLQNVKNNLARMIKK